MKLYHVSVEQDEGWLIGRVLEREGITTQGRSLDELVFMVRDAIQLMWNEKGVDLEFIMPGKAATAFERRKTRQHRNGSTASGSIRRTRPTKQQVA